MWTSNVHVIDMIANIPSWLFPVFTTTVLGLIVSICIYKWRDRVTARSEFRKAFDPILTEFRQDKADLISIMEPKVKAAVKGQEEAITAFRHHLTGRRRRIFDSDCVKYRECRDRCLASGPALIAADVRRYLNAIGAPKCNALEGLRQSIEKLMEHAR
jgi:hypothetical protein